MQNAAAGTDAKPEIKMKLVRQRAGARARMAREADVDPHAASG